MLAAAFDRWLWRTSRAAPAHEQTHGIEVPDGVLRIRDSGGTNNALVFLCDPPVSVEAYDELIDVFAARYRVVVVELPNFGFSKSRSTRTATFAGAVADVEAALESLDLGACVLFGPCICGFVAAELARRGQLHVRGVVLMQAPDKAGLLAWVERMDPKHMLRIPLLGQLIVRLSAKRITRFWVQYATARDSDSGALSRDCESALDAGGAYPLATMLQLWGDGTNDAALDVPGLIVWGKQDRSHRDTASESSRAHLPAADIVEFADCGHFVELEQPLAFAESVTPFLGQCFQDSSP